jgi:GNAT superfamily N-acetyltransferase
MVVFSIDHGSERSARVQPVPLRADHLPQALDLSAGLNWPYRLEDWAFAHGLGRGLAVEIKGRLAGTALWWPYGAQFGSAGMVIVAPTAQRRGIGRALMQALIEQAGERNLILNSTRDGYDLYTSLGFAPCGMVYQHQALLAAAPPVEPVAGLRLATPADHAAIARLDRAGSGMERKALLGALLTQAQTMVIEREGVVVGYACRRAWGRGQVIGPVVTGGQADARGLIAALAQGQQGRFLRIDVTRSSGLSPWLAAIGLVRVDEVVTMVRGSAPVAGDGVQLFALSNQSLG